MTRRVAVIGAGAAGTLAALFAASEGAETELLERTADGGRKVLISGGGRCNILPARHDESRFVTDSSPHALRKMLRSWPLREQIAFFERDAGIPLVEEEASAKLFPASQSARDVRDRLIAAAVGRGARFVPRTVVTHLAPRGRGWRIDREGGDPIEADAVVVATGGLSVPQTGSDGRGLAILESLGHTVRPTYPALTPLTVDAAMTPFTELSGVSLDVALSARAAGQRAEATGGFLFTHRGFSGPAILDVSHVVTRAAPDDDPKARVLVRWTPLGADEWETLLQPSSALLVAGVMRRHLPERLGMALMKAAGVPAGRKLAELRREERVRLIAALTRFPLPWSGHEGYRKAEVTGGGVSLDEVDPLTMESRRHKGLFLCGELLDAFGPIGGFNFQWAWATGRAAGRGAARAQ